VPAAGVVVCVPAVVVVVVWVPVVVVVPGCVVVVVVVPGCVAVVVVVVAPVLVGVPEVLVDPAGLAGVVVVAGLAGVVGVAGTGFFGGGGVGAWPTARTLRVSNATARTDTLERVRATGIRRSIM